MSLRATSVIVVPPQTPVAELARSVCTEREAQFVTLDDLRAVPAAIEGSTAKVVLVDVSQCHELAAGDLVEISRRAALVLVGPGANLPRLARWAGADDYLFDRELSAPALERALKHALERRRGRALVQHLLDHDPITGAPHAAYFRGRVSEAITAARSREGGRVSVLLLDLDRFDVVNETFGYDAGDTVLREAVARLTRVVGREHLARVHADKLAVLFDEKTDRDDLVRGLRQALEPAYVLDRQDVQLTASMGVAEFPTDGADADALMRATTRAMRRAKHVGRNNVQMATSSLAPPALASRPRERFALERDLRHAVDRGELLLHYQPQLDVRTGQVLGVEALVRWNRPGVGMISPADFVPLLEETGLILPASDWILLAACQQIRDWMAQGLPPLRVAVNVSATQIRQRRLLPGVERALKLSGLMPELLELELTEGLLIENTNASGATLEALRQMGSSISLDDFGTGYSSLSYLKRLPIDVVKIDRCFLQEVPKVQTDAAITSAIITLAHELGHRVVAEGVETAQQLEFLEAHRCDAAQGFFLSRPLPADRCFEWLEAQMRSVRGSSGSYPTAGFASTAAQGSSRAG